MLTPKLSFKTGLWATLSALFLGFLIPVAYDKFGAGPSLVKHRIHSSETLRRLCGTPARLYIVPWRLSVSDSDSEGQLSMSYWLACGGGTARVDAELVHAGDDWNFLALALHYNRTTYQLYVPDGKKFP